jgi:hypothetical protein
MFRINSYTVVALASLVLFWVQPAIEPKAVEVPNVEG